MRKIIRAKSHGGISISPKVTKNKSVRKFIKKKSIQHHKKSDLKIKIYKVANIKMPNAKR